MNKNNTIKKNRINILFIIFTILITITLPIINYSIFDKHIKTIIIISLFLSLTILFIFTSYKKNLLNFLYEAKTELKNITWPTNKELKQSTIMILIIVSCVSFVLWIIDSIFTYIISKII